MTTLLPPGAGRPYATLRADAGETPLDIPREQFIDAYKRYGALLLRGYRVDIEAFRKLTARYCTGSVFNESQGREVLDADRNIQTVNIGTHAFPLHPELSREPWKPDVCFFWCMSPPTHGGETTVCDGIEIVRNLPRAAYQAFAGRRLRYTRPALPAECVAWLGDADPSDAQLAHPPAGTPFTFTRSNGHILRSFTRPAFHKPMFSDEPAFGNFLLFGRYLTGNKKFPTFEDGVMVPDELMAEVKATSDRITAPIDWTQDDIAVLDNTRFMHGRNAITDVAERRIATYFGYLNFAIPDPEEGPDPLWRRGDFRAPGL